MKNTTKQTSPFDRSLFSYTSKRQRCMEPPNAGMNFEGSGRLPELGISPMRFCYLEALHACLRKADARSRCSPCDTCHFKTSVAQTHTQNKGVSVGVSLMVPFFLVLTRTPPLNVHYDPYHSRAYPGLGAPALVISEVPNCIYIYNVGSCVGSLQRVCLNQNRRTHKCDLIPRVLTHTRRV